MPTTAKRPVVRPRERKPSAEAPPVPDIDHASEILPSLSNDVSRSQADSMSIHGEAEDAQCNIFSASRSLPIEHALHILNKHPPPNIGAFLDLYVIVSALILDAIWPRNYFLVAPIIEIIR